MPRMAFLVNSGPGIQREILLTLLLKYVNVVYYRIQTCIVFWNVTKIQLIALTCTVRKCHLLSRHLYWHCNACLMLPFFNCCFRVKRLSKTGLGDKLASSLYIEQCLHAFSYHNWNIIVYSLNSLRFLCYCLQNREFGAIKTPWLKCWWEQRNTYPVALNIFMDIVGVVCFYIRMLIFITTFHY